MNYAILIIHASGYREYAHVGSDTLTVARFTRKQAQAQAAFLRGDLKDVQSVSVVPYPDARHSRNKETT